MGHITAVHGWLTADRRGRRCIGSLCLFLQQLLILIPLIGSLHDLAASDAALCLKLNLSLTVMKDRTAHRANGEQRCRYRFLHDGNSLLGQEITCAAGSVQAYSNNMRVTASDRVIMPYLICSRGIACCICLAICALLNDDPSRIQMAHNLVPGTIECVNGDMISSQRPLIGAAQDLRRNG